MPLRAAQDARGPAGAQGGWRPGKLRFPIKAAVNVIALTVFVGLLLVGFFIALWWMAARDPRSFNERDALLPLEPEQPEISSRKNEL